MVRLGLGLFAIPLSWVDEALWFVELSPLAGAAASSLGTLNLRGEPIPVVDAAAFFHGSAALHGPEDWLVVLTVRGRRVAFVAEALGAVRRLEPNDWQPMDRALVKSPWALGLVAHESDIAVLVDLEALVEGVERQGLLESADATGPGMRP